MSRFTPSVLPQYVGRRKPDLLDALEEGVTKYRSAEDAANAERNQMTMAGGREVLQPSEMSRVKGWLNRVSGRTTMPEMTLPGVDVELDPARSKNLPTADGPQPFIPHPTETAPGGVRPGLPVPLQTTPGFNPAAPMPSVASELGRQPMDEKYTLRGGHGRRYEFDPARQRNAALATKRSELELGDEFDQRKENRQFSRQQQLLTQRGQQALAQLRANAAAKAALERDKQTLGLSEYQRRRLAIDQQNAELRGIALDAGLNYREAEIEGRQVLTPEQGMLVEPGSPQVAASERAAGARTAALGRARAARDQLHKQPWQKRADQLRAAGRSGAEIKAILKREGLIQ